MRRKMLATSLLGALSLLAVAGSEASADVIARDDPDGGPPVFFRLNPGDTTLVLRIRQDLLRNDDATGRDRSVRFVRTMFRSAGSGSNPFSSAGIASIRRSGNLLRIRFTNAFANSIGNTTIFDYLARSSNRRRVTDDATVFIRVATASGN